MSNLSKSIIDKIKKKHLKPTSKWIFHFKHSIMWGLFGLSVLFGSIAISIIFFQFRDAGWDIYSQMNDGVVEFILLALPYFWLVLMVGFLTLAYYHFRHTKKGYRYNIFAIIGLSLLTSLMLGSALYASGFSERLETLFQEIPHYEKLHVGKRLLWHRPDQGFLAGTILQMGNGKIILLQDFRQEKWNVDIQDAKARKDIELKRGLRVRITGTDMGKHEFKAFGVAPWHRPMEPPPFFQRIKLK